MQFDPSTTIRGRSAAFGRGSEYGAPKTSFAQKSAVDTGHTKNLLQTCGFSAVGAEELINGHDLSELGRSQSFGIFGLRASDTNGESKIPDGEQCREGPSRRD